MKDPIETYMNLVPMVVEQTNRGERAYDIFSRPLKEHINLDVHQLAGWRGDIGSCDLRHDAAYPLARIDGLHGAGGVDGISASGGG